MRASVQVLEPVPARVTRDRWPELGLLVFDERDRPQVHRLELDDGWFVGRLRQRRKDQPSITVALVSASGRPLARVVLPRPPRERGAPVLVEVEVQGERVALRAWAEDDLGYAETSVPLPA